MTALCLEEFVYIKPTENAPRWSFRGIVSGHKPVLPAFMWVDLEDVYQSQSGDASSEAGLLKEEAAMVWGSYL